MKTIIHFFENWNSVKHLFTEFPQVMETDRDTFEDLQQFDGKGFYLDCSVLYHNFWIKKDANIIIPDVARLPKSKKGFYLEQTDEMKAIRDNTKQCSFCSAQYFMTLQSFCPECIGNGDVPEEEIYRTFLRPVNTLDIQLSIKSLKVPKFITERHVKLPELTYSGHLLNI